MPFIMGDTFYTVVTEFTMSFDKNAMSKKKRTITWLCLTKHKKISKII